MLISLLPHTDNALMWALILAGAAVVNGGLVWVVDWLGFNQAHPAVTFVAGAVSVAAAIFGTMLLVRARDIFWNDTWHSVALLVLLVLVIAGASAWVAFDEDLEDGAVVAVFASAAVCAIGILLWAVVQITDAVDRSLQPVGLGGVLVLALLGGAFLWADSQPRRR